MVPGRSKSHTDNSIPVYLSSRASYAQPILTVVLSGRTPRRQNLWQDRLQLKSRTNLRKKEIGARYFIIETGMAITPDT